MTEPNVTQTINVQDNATANVTGSGDINIGPVIPRKDESLCVLFVGASPADVQTGPGRIRPEREFAKIQDVAQTGHIRLVSRLAAGITDLDGVLKEQPDILHLACHGDGSEIYFERDSGRAHPVPADEVADTLKLYRDDGKVTLRAIVLQVCRSSEMAALFTPLADVVVSWRGEVDERVAVAFSQRFYQDLRHTKPIAAAARLAVRHVATGKGWPLALGELDVSER